MLKKKTIREYLDKHTHMQLTMSSHNASKQLDDIVVCTKYKILSKIIGKAEWGPLPC